jgi:ribosomal protein S18 acetylase RimI-like enzyme
VTLLRPLRPQDEPGVLALWARALPDWPVSAGAFAEKTRGTTQLVAVAGGAIAGYAAAASAGERGQVTAILVDPAHRRRGIGSALLAEARRTLAGRGATTLSAGSGAGAYFWPGVPDTRPEGWAFFRARGFVETATSCDLLGDVRAYRTPDWVRARVEPEVRFELAGPGDAGEIVELQQRNFPYWIAIYERQVALPKTILVARLGGRIVGTCTVEGPAERDFLWQGLVDGPVGEFGAVGVDPQARGAGIGLAMVARACELLSERGAETCYCAYTYVPDWYGKLGFTHWRTYTMASSAPRLLQSDEARPRRGKTR